MKKNESSYNIDKEHDEIKIGLNIYNNSSYDILNKRDILSKPIVEIKLTNVSQIPIEIYSPHLSIETKNVNTIYCSLALQKHYPIQLMPFNLVEIPFNSANFHHLLSQQTDEIVRIFVKDNFSKIYSSVNIEGDVLEGAIEDKNVFPVYRAKTIYQFDTIVSTKNIELPKVTQPIPIPKVSTSFFKKLKSIFIID